MTHIIIAGVVALIVGILIGYIVIRLALKHRSENIIKEAEAEAEVIKKIRFSRQKKNFCKSKQNMRNRPQHAITSFWLLKIN